MTTFKETVRMALIAYPTMYVSPLDVSIGLFTGGGYDWKDGVIDHRDGWPVDRPLEEKLHPPNTKMFQHHLAYEAQKMRYQAVLDNMDRILKVETLATYDIFGDQHRHCYYVINPNTSYAHGMNPPDDIKPDWARAVYDFAGWWKWMLNVHHGVDTHAKDQAEFKLKYWSACARTAYDELEVVCHKVFPIFNPGRTYQGMLDLAKKIVTSVVEERCNGSKEEEAIGADK